MLTQEKIIALAYSDTMPGSRSELTRSFNAPSGSFTGSPTKNFWLQNNPHKRIESYFSYKNMQFVIKMW